MGRATLRSARRRRRADACERPLARATVDSGRKVNRSLAVSVPGAWGKMALPPEEEVEDFLSQVDEVSTLIDGLQKGNIDPQVLLQRDQAQAQKREEKERRAKVGR
eukprot:scaffold4990_cov387-Prasinococcus_capsulatus_cf.AAC.8